MLFGTTEDSSGGFGGKATLITGKTRNQEKPTILCERAQITTARIISTRAVIKQ